MDTPNTFNAFQDCTSLETVTLPESITRIDTVAEASVSATDEATNLPAQKTDEKTNEKTEENAIRLAASYADSFKLASQKVKDNAQQMMKYGTKFSCLVLDVKATNPKHNPNDENSIPTFYPFVDQISEWLVKLYASDLKNKPLHPKALEQMKLKGVEPPREATQIMLITIVPATDRVCLCVSFPEGTGDPAKFVEKVVTKIRNVDPDSKITICPSTGYVLLTYTCEFPIKESDVCARYCFAQLKEDGIYEEPVDSDED